VQIRGLRYPLIAVIVVVVFCLLLTGQWVYKKYFLEQPVVKALDSLPEVENSEFFEQTNTVTIKLKEVPNLQKAYLKIDSKLRKQRGSEDLKIVILDNRNRLLERVLYQSQFAVHQAIMQGDFIHMLEYISNLAKEAGVDKFNIFIDSNNIYLQFHEGNSYLYEIVSRKVLPNADSTMPRGG